MKTAFGKILLIILGVVMTIFGISLMATPFLTEASLVIVYGAFILVTGVVGIINFFTSSSAPGQKTGGALVLAIINIILGLMILSRIAIAAAALPFVISFWLIMRGITTLIFAIDLRHIPNSNWGWAAVFAVLTIITGFLGVAHPIAVVVGVSTMIAIQFIVMGLSVVVEGIMYNSHKG